ncbi:NfeD family protein [Actinotalea sp. K2]|nr:NfeD family protein [Actinotalea sp. K2]
MHWLWWLVAAVALGVIEILTLDLVLLMFAGGALAALVASQLGANVTVQVLTFALTSLFFLIVLRPYLLRNLRKRMPLVETNAAAQVGRHAVTMTEVTDRGGQIKLVGEVWSARAEAPGRTYPADISVRVLRIEGATAVVGPLDAEPQDPPDIPATSPQTDIQEDRT